MFASVWLVKNKCLTTTWDFDLIQLFTSSSSDIVIRCCNDFPLDYYFKDNILFGYKIDETILKDSYNRYTNYIDSLKIQQQKRKTIIKSKR